jgi:hypothetical protein
MSDENRRRFDCPGCGGDSWFLTDTAQVEHSEPHCKDWIAAQASPAAAANALLGAAAVLSVAPPPEEVIFNCPACAASVRMRPRDLPISVAHSLPYCESWEQIEGKKDDVERFLIKAGVHVLVPERN